MNISKLSLDATPEPSKSRQSSLASL